MFRLHAFVESKKISRSSFSDVLLESHACPCHNDHLGRVPHISVMSLRLAPCFYNVGYHSCPFDILLKVARVVFNVSIMLFRYLSFTNYVFHHRARVLMFVYLLIIVFWFLHSKKRAKLPLPLSATRSPDLNADYLVNKVPPRLGGGLQKLCFEILEPFILKLPDLPIGPGQDFLYVDHVSEEESSTYPISKGFIHARGVPLCLIVPCVPLHAVFKIAKGHLIDIGSHVPKSAVLPYFLSHNCDLCNSYITVFKLKVNKAKKEALRQMTLRRSAGKLSKQPHEHGIACKGITNLSEESQISNPPLSDISASRFVVPVSSVINEVGTTREVATTDLPAVQISSTKLACQHDVPSSSLPHPQKSSIKLDRRLKEATSGVLTDPHSSSRKSVQQRSSNVNRRVADPCIPSTAAQDESTEFPPCALDDKLSCDIIRSFCEESAPENLEEAGCAVCGLLTPVSQLTRLKAVKNLLHVVQISGVSRIERKKPSDPIREFTGPILDYRCDRICDTCRKHVRNSRIPPSALANGLWIGEVPEELSCLRFVEKMLIARVRVSGCLVRVASSGLRKMSSHVIAFETPVPKVYHSLPPPIEDLDEVLAVLFTGPCKPTEKEYQRTPLLVRRNYVARALEWLKLNHADYADLEISYDRLNTYPEDSPPVSIEYRHSETNKIEEGTSVFDQETDDGVAEGECAFLVHGLTGEQMATKTVEELKGIALRHWNNQGGALAVSHAANPVSIYNNPNLYPQIFPWLFPYGLGGIGSADLSDRSHKRHLLMYHDKRFQRDATFPFVAFSHEQIKAATTAGFLLAETRKFTDIANRLLNVNQEVLADISRRLSEGVSVKPESDDEKACFQLIHDLDHINGKVAGSSTSKKYMRSEIWSLIDYVGAPLWYITLSPADNKHPLCLYFADNTERFDVSLTRTEDDRYRLIAKNPVASARFFHFMVEMFIKHVLGVQSQHRGLYGDTAAYYGTVEQQGRLTLHLHLLLWIRGCPSPDEMRRRILDPTSDFRQKLVDYLESAHSGDFLTGSKEEVEANVQAASRDAEYRNPTETLPKSPPPPCLKPEPNECERCVSLTSWWSYFKGTVDDLILRSNIHRCSTNKNKDGSQNKARPFKGCLDNIWGVCKARFPRPTFKETVADPETGGIHMKKTESWLNTFTYVLSYLFRCNTDVTSLRSGTAIKAVLRYVSNYVTKSPLKTHVIFDTIRSMFLNNSEMIGGSDSRKDKARKLMTKIINSLSAKMEMGSPMISMYLLGNPDHYKSHTFRPFYWQSFVHEVQKPWINVSEISDAACSFPASEDSHLCEKVAIIKSKNRIIGLSPVQDYVFRPHEYESMNLYDWISRTECEKLPMKKKREDLSRATNPLPEIDSHAILDAAGLVTAVDEAEGPIKENIKPLLPFLKGHPLHDSHGIRCCAPVKGRIPNFVGATLPRYDQGDRDYYCCTMLTLFKPWRSGLDLKCKEETWDDAFTSSEFSPRQREIMKNMNIRYECLDAQDDFYAQMKKGARDSEWKFGDGDEQFLQNPELDDVEDCVNVPDDHLVTSEIFISSELGKRAKARYRLMADTRRLLNNIGWSETRSSPLQYETSASHQNPRPSISYYPPSTWKALVAAKRAQILEERSRHLLPETQISEGHTYSTKFVPNEVRVVDKSYLEKAYKSTKWQARIDDIAQHFSLNKEQDRAFRIVANHSCSPDADQLRMYIAGMAGTGKSQVLKALTNLFRCKNQSHRIISVAPTGSAAALLGGSTYHYMFGINMDGVNSSNIQLAQIKSRLQGVHYVFLDEVSMLSCRDLYLISERLACIMNNLDTPFGGMNMIFAGDFAQLPPVIGQEHAALYSRSIGRNATSLRGQEAAIGKALWHQVTTVVILRQNMRQKSQSHEDALFRRVLTNMRYKACTPEDIAFLKTRVTSGLPGCPNINDDRFRNVSIITALNSVKDEINHVGSLRFAAETRQELTHFFAIDMLTNESNDVQKGKQGRPRTSTRKQSMRQSKLSENILNILWDQPCNANTKLIPAKLSLCVGMPVMIRNNTATELCITKGQEAVVHSWQSSLSGNGRLVLDTLFVELINPPSVTTIAGLPPNVVPLIKTSTTTTCHLPDDSSLTISRNQIEVVPNFAMTDYASQGKTREYNVVDLSYSRSHQGYYTALSRSASAAGTLILCSFHPSKITGGASGALRQEFRELELLNDITALRFEAKLPHKIAMAERRKDLITLFREYKGADYLPSEMHRAIRWSKTDPFLEWEDSGIEWHVLEKKGNIKKSKVEKPCAKSSTTETHLGCSKSPSTFASSMKADSPINKKENIKKTKVEESCMDTPTTIIAHSSCSLSPSSHKSPMKAVTPIDEKKRSTCVLVPKRRITSRLSDTTKRTLKKAKLFEDVLVSGDRWHIHPNNLPTPIGTRWLRNSCAYDAVFTILFNVWREDPLTMDDCWRDLDSENLNFLLDEFRNHESLPSADNSCNRSLDEIRNIMINHFSELSPHFQPGEYTSIDALLSFLLTGTEIIAISERSCINGHDIPQRSIDITNCTFTLLPGRMTHSTIQDYFDDFTVSLDTPCPTCECYLFRKFSFITHPPLLAIELNESSPSVVPKLRLNTIDSESHSQYILRGLIYFSSDHFTARFIANSDTIWYHDGLLTGHSLMHETFHSTTTLPMNNAIAAIYVRIP